MDTKNARVQKFDSDGKYLFKWGSPGYGDGQFSIILPDVGRLAVDPQGNVYVIDHGNSRIQKFDAAGNFLKKWGTSGDGDIQFQDPSDIIIDKQSNVYVTDYAKSDVQKFDDNGHLLLRWQSPGSIYSLAIDPDGNILVADKTGRIRKFDTSGALLSEIRPKPIDKIAIELWNIAVDKQGNIYIVDHSGFRIVILDNRGEFLATWRGSNTGAAMFDNLQDIAIDERGNIYITDSSSNLVQKFRQLVVRP
jgi:DNA-binding beta-propeller fold protein YncE